MFVTVSRTNAVGVITLANPARRNALSRALVEECLAALETLATERVRAVVLRAAADAAVWSAGHDITELAAGVDPLAADDPLERLLRAIESFPAPVIAMIHGTVWGGATELVLSCDLAVADPTCTLAITPAKLGLAYNTAGLKNLLSRVPVNVLRELIFTARPIGAEQALAWGLLNHVVSATELEPFTMELAEQITRQSPEEIATVKAQLRALIDSPVLSPETQQHLEAMRHAVYAGPDFAEGLQAFRSKRTPDFIAAETATGSGTEPIAVR